MKPTCPHCKVFLLDRKNPPLPAQLIWLLAGVTVVGYLAVPSGCEEPVWGVLLANLRRGFVALSRESCQ